MTTCQICAREIKANTGVIAHHGYRRPGGGWQTASCAGARFLPYEKACDRLPPTIFAIQAFIARRTAELATMMANPPATLKLQRRSVYDPRPEQDVEKPAEFKPIIDGWGEKPRTYENVFYNMIYEIKRSIQMSETDLEFMQDRLARWVAPEKAES